MAHCVTCVFCGGDADETETERIVDDIMELGPSYIVENPLAFGAKLNAVADHGRGEAHDSCWSDFFASYRRDVVAPGGHGSDVSGSDVGQCHVEAALFVLETVRDDWLDAPEHEILNGAHSIVQEYEQHELS